MEEFYEATTWVEIKYVTIDGAAGVYRTTLGQFPRWLADRPGYFVVAVRPV
jgi:hypothetical protein